ncbi:MAG: DUF3016 domain-containing protein [Alphaproteobacteria bacterium]|nr:DUF3016 domain-containing protein [Alphaproteobacteria bacterium]
MPSRITLLALIALSAIGLGPAPGSARAAPSVAVVFVDPQSYVDARQFGASRSGADKAVLSGLRTHLERLGGRALAPGQSLVIEVLQIDLAGYRRTARNADAARIATDADWPSMRLHYVLSEGGVAVLTATETVADANYLRHGGPYANDSLRYEKRMLDDWFQARIVDRRAPQP